MEEHINKFALCFADNQTYFIPFAILKWIIVLTRYGRSLLPSNNTPPALQSRYKYELQLITVCRSVMDRSEVIQESHLTLILEDNTAQLSYCGQDCNKIPPALHRMYGAKVRYLDLSYNSIETLKGLDQFIRLEELILDNNKLGDGVEFPCLPHLKTLSLNNNQITRLERLMDTISVRYPALSYLSLLSNKACPNQLSDLDKDDSDYQRYRYFVIYKLPKLRFLDSRRVSSSEHREATTRGQFMCVKRPVDDTDSPQTVREHSVRPLPVDFDALGKHKGAYGKCNYKYTGKHSEGNRFILNSDL